MVAEKTNEWLGFVIDIKGKTIHLDLKDKFDTSKVATDTGKMPIFELSKSDQKKLMVGSIIELTIWIKHLPNGKKEEYLETSVRDAPRITPKQMRQALKRAKKSFKDWNECTTNLA